MRFKHYDIDMVMKEANVWSGFKKIQSHLDLTREKIAPGFKKEKSRTWIWPGMKYRPPSTQACHACTPFCKPGQHLNIQGTFPGKDPQLTIAHNFVLKELFLQR